MKKIIAIIVIINLFFISCRESRWEIISINKFINNNIIDSSNYITFEKATSLGKIKKIPTPGSSSHYCHFYLPLIQDNKYVFIEKTYLPDEGKNIILKFDNTGKVLDSIIINRDSKIINDYIIEKEYFSSWFIDNDKKMKKLENVNFLKSDTTKIQELVKSFIKNNIIYYSTSDGYSQDDIDTCNYIISFKKNKLIKYNYSKKIRPESELKIKEGISSEFSKDFKQISLVKSKEIFKIDNFFVKNKQKFIRGNEINFRLTTTGTGGTECDNFCGTIFLTFLEQPNLKIKKMNETFCENEKIDNFLEDNKVYTEEFLKFYVIDEHAYIENSYFYIVKK